MGFQNDSLHVASGSFRTVIGFLFLLHSIHFGVEPIRAQTSIYPMGGQTGTVVEAEIRAGQLAGVSRMVFGSPILSATVVSEEKISTVDVNGSPQEITLVKASIHIPATAELGAYSFQLISESGLSSRLPFQVVSESSILEMESAHDLPSLAQEIEYPCVVQARITEMGEVDYYAFHADGGEEVAIELITASGLIPEIRAQFFPDPSLELYRAEGSWFDPNRPARIQPVDESTSFMFPRKFDTGAYTVGLPRLRYRVEEEGWHLIRVGCIRDVGEPDLCYQLRVIPNPDSLEIAWTPRRLVNADTLEWHERSLSRAVGQDWIDRIRARTGNDPESATQPVPILNESEPNDTLTGDATLTLPILIEGTIGSPGDTDLFGLNVKEGESIVIEVRTPDATYPHFAPWISLFDKDENLLVNNFYRTISNGTPIWVKVLEPKMVYTFKEAGFYTLRIRDLTSRRGGEDYRYQLVLRPKIPHIGEIGAMHVDEPFLNRRDRIAGIHVARGKMARVKVVTEREEGFDGEVAIEFENLPDGVRVLPGAAVEKKVTESGNVFEILGSVNKEFYRPDRQVTSLLIAADADAATTEVPQTILLKATPIKQGTPGKPFPIQKLPLLVMN